MITFAAAAVETAGEQIGKLFEDVDRSALRAGLSRLLKVAEPELSSRLAAVGDELLFHFYNDAELRQSFRASLTGEPQPRSFAAEAPVTAPSPTRTRLVRSASPTLAGVLGD